MTCTAGLLDEALIVGGGGGAGGSSNQTSSSATNRQGGGGGYTGFLTVTDFSKRLLLDGVMFWLSGGVGGLSRMELLLPRLQGRLHICYLKELLTLVLEVELAAVIRLITSR